MNALPELDLTKILVGFYRRKGVILAVFVAVFSLTAYLSTTLPNVYRSSTLILITPQRIPSSYVPSTVTSGIEERIQAMTQQILSRTRLEKIVQEFNLYPASSPGVTMEDRVEKFRKQISFDVSRSDAFTISFEAESPQKAMEVTGRLASIFIQENLELREQQAMGTTTFIHAEADRLRKELEEQEAQVNRFKIQYQFELPEQLEANLRTVEQLHGEHRNNMALLSSLQQRKTALEKQVVEAETMAPEVANVKGEVTSRPRWQQIEILNNELKALLIRYSEKHPDVIRVKKEIETLEAGEGVEKSQSTKSGSVLGRPIGSPIRQTLLKQIQELHSEINSLQAKNRNLQDQISAYQTRINNTPLRGIELSKISRTYDITLGKYRDLLAKGLESQLSENMEKKQKGEQFRILDPASFPQKPVRPNRRFILLLGLLGGLAAGFGLAFLLESLDTSFKRSDELEAYVNVPLLATIPAIATRGSILAQRRAQAILVLASVGIMVIGIVWIRFFGPSFFLS